MSPGRRRTTSLPLALGAGDGSPFWLAFWRSGLRSDVLAGVLAFWLAFCSGVLGADVLPGVLAFWRSQSLAFWRSGVLAFCLAFWRSAWRSAQLEVIEVALPPCC